MRLLSTYIIAALLLTTGCKQDFDITSEYTEIPIVYGLLNQQENTHYIRIQKGFLFEGNALTAAGVADSIYYTDSLLVQLKSLPNGPAITLQKVDGNTLGLPKAPGLFANEPNWLYRANAALDAGKSYRLEVTNTNSGKTIFAETNLVKDFTISVPFKSQKILISSTSTPKIVFYTPANAGMYDLTLRFPYKEYDALSNTLVLDSFADIKLYKSQLTANSVGGDQIVREINGTVLLSNLSQQLEKRNDRYREFNIAKGMTLFFAMGGDELARYINAQLTQATGISSNEAVSPYTNINGGYGIFSSRYFKQVDSILLTEAALDTLACSPLATGLRFKGSTGQICE